jgi:hypothetical protein
MTTEGKDDLSPFSERVRRFIERLTVSERIVLCSSQGEHTSCDPDVHLMVGRLAQVSLVLNTEALQQLDLAERAIRLLSRDGGGDRC